MLKQEFLAQLRDALCGLPQCDIDERLTFYSEIIDDRMEDGLPEEEAVAAVGSVDEIFTQVVAEIPFSKIVKERIKPKRRLTAWEIVLLALGSPIWLSLSIAAFAVGISVYAVLWSLIISLWAAFGAVIACAFGGILSGIVLALGGKALIGMALIGTSLVCLGISILLFWLCKGISKATVWLTRKLLHAVRKLLFGKEMA